MWRRISKVIFKMCQIKKPIMLFSGMPECTQLKKLHWCFVTNWFDFNLYILTSSSDFIIVCVRNVASICMPWNEHSLLQVLLLSLILTAIWHTHSVFVYLAYFFWSYSNLGQSPKVNFWELCNSNCTFYGPVILCVTQQKASKPWSLINIAPSGYWDPVHLWLS